MKQALMKLIVAVRRFKKVVAEVVAGEMQPVEFEGCNCVLAKDQPEYVPLPVLRHGVYVISCWQLSWLDRWKLVWTGQLWLSIIAGNQLLQPQRPSVDRPFKIERKVE